MRRIALFCLALTGLSSIATADLGIGISAAYGVYYPKSTFIRGVFGSTWQGFGLSPSTTTTPSGFVIDTDIDFIVRERGSNRITMFTPSVGISTAVPRQFSGATNVVPYGAARVGFTIADYRFTSGTSTFDATKTLFNMNVEGGVVFNGTLRLSVRWDNMAKTDGLDFSGYSFRATYQLLKF